MTTRDVGDRVNLQHLVYNSSGVLTAATVVLTVTDPAGLTSTPTVTAGATGTYTASFTLATAGVWSWVWDVAGAVIDVERGSVIAGNPAPPTYASLVDLKAYMRITDTTEDALLGDALQSASRWITKHCRRTFGQATTASARTFKPLNPRVAKVDDFWVTTGLIIATDAGSDGTFETVWAASDYELEPADGIVDGEPGWPYWTIRGVDRYFPLCARRRSLQVTAKWGWAAIPDPVRRACIQVAEEDYKMKGAPFGVANTDQFGPIRVRDSQKVISWLQPYRRSPILVG